MLSVIVPAHNGGAALRRCLAALAPTVGVDDELILADDGSTDDTAQVALGFGARVVPVSEPGRPQGPAAARNAGVAEASGDVVVFIDADVVVKPDTLGRIAARFADDPELAALFGSYDTEPSEPNFISQYRNLLHHFVHQRSEAEAHSFWAGCGAIRREVFEAVGGFDAGAYPYPSIEDIELGLRLSEGQYPIALDKSIQVTHLKRWTLRGMLHADIFRRAIPWTRLIIRKGAMPNDLNLRASARVSGALVLAFSLLVVAVPVLAWLAAPASLTWGAGAAALLAASAVVLLNRSVYGFFARVRGVWFMLGTVPMHILYYLYSTVTFAYCQVRYRALG